MKKIYLAFVLAFSLISFLQAQSYHPLVETGKLWSTYHWNMIPNPPTSDYIKFEGDTVFGTVTYKKVLKTEHENMTQWTYYGAIREDAQKKVYLQRAYTLNNEILLYDFNIIPGDSLLLVTNPNYYILDSVGTITLATGEQRKSYMLHYTGYACNDTWVEGIGSITYGVMNPAFCGFVGDSPSMLCAWENDTLKYHGSLYPLCFVLTGISDLPQDGQNIKVFPNPATDKITITYSQVTQEDIDVTIFTINGEALLNQKFRYSNPLDMDVSRLVKGIYLVKIQTRDLLDVEKLVIY